MDIDILLVGSSIVKKWKNIKEKFPNKKIVNIGEGGKKTHELLYDEYFNRILRYNPKYIIYYCGGNDINKNTTKAEIYNNIKLFNDKIRNVYKNKIIYISIIKSPKKKIDNKLNEIDYVNNHIKLLCNKKTFYVNINKELNNIEYYKKDMNHLRYTGYDKINEKLPKYIK
jgi:lysophospholipase L1-like esterase